MELKSRKPDRVDVFGNIELKSIENDFYPSDSRDVYELHLDSDQHVATVYVSNSERQGLEKEGESCINNLYSSRVLEPMESAERYNHLERMEREVYDRMGLDQPADVGLVEVVEEAGL